jgi:hypothetical protein
VISNIIARSYLDHSFRFHSTKGRGIKKQTLVWAFGRVEFQAELHLYGAKDVRAEIGRRGAIDGMRLIRFYLRDSWRSFEPIDECAIRRA